MGASDRVTGHSSIVESSAGRRVVSVLSLSDIFFTEIYIDKFDERHSGKGDEGVRFSCNVFLNMMCIVRVGMAGGVVRHAIVSGVF